jgi:hypothetical protein
MRGTNRLQCRQGQQEYCSQVFSCRHDCFHAVLTFLTGSTEEGEDTSFLSSLSSRFDSVFIGRRKKSARSTSSFRYAPTFIFISYCHPKQFYRHPFESYRHPNHYCHHTQTTQIRHSQNFWCR